MKPDQEIIAEATRVEYEEKTGKLFIVFEVTNEKLKQDIKKNWTKNIEYKIVDKCLMLNNE